VRGLPIGHQPPFAAIRLHEPMSEDRTPARPATRVPAAAVFAAALAVAVALGGCSAGGPDFEPPAAPAATGYLAGPLPAQTASAPGDAGQAQQWARGADIPAQWWALFHSDALDQLIRSALVHSPTLASAQAALRQARENLSAQSGRLQAPAVDAQLGTGRQRESALTTGTPNGALFTLYNASVNVSYTLDAFGGTRRQLESAQAAVDLQRFQLEAAYLSLTGNLVTSAIREASLRAQLQAWQEVLDAQGSQLEVIEKQFDIGAVSQSAVLAQRTRLAQTQTAVAPLEKELAQTRHQLAVYAGQPPGAAALPEFDLAKLELPQTLPLSLPSDLARQRPDVRASIATLHQASAQVGVATANLYPQIQLSASYGSTATEPGALFSDGNVAWSLLAGLTQPIFHGGALRAQRRAAVAAYDAAAAQYRQTLLGAFQNVADALRALQFDATSLETQSRAESLARQSLDLTTQQYRIGAVSYVELLTAQQAWLQTHTDLVQARAARFADSAALFQALGGGWWNRGALADISTDVVGIAATEASAAATAASAASAATR
jgi:NodT family efflux transporter outer membrane factor (OMF) lipoprotein